METVLILMAIAVTVLAINLVAVTSWLVEAKREDRKLRPLLWQLKDSVDAIKAATERNTPKPPISTK